MADGVAVNAVERGRGPAVVLVWALLVEDLSPGLSAFYATVLLIAILLTQRPLLAFFRNQPTQPWSYVANWRLPSPASLGRVGLSIARETALDVPDLRVEQLMVVRGSRRNNFV